MSNDSPATTGNLTSDDDIRRLARTARSLVWALRRFGEKQAGLTLLPQSEIEVLRVLAERPGSTVSDVARHARRSGRCTRQGCPMPVPPCLQQRTRAGVDRTVIVRRLSPVNART